MTFKQSGEPTTPLTSDLTLQLLNSNDHHLRNKCLDWILILICTYLLQLRTACLTSEDHVFLPTHPTSRCKHLLSFIESAPPLIPLPSSLSTAPLQVEGQQLISSFLFQAKFLSLSLWLEMLSLTERGGRGRCRHLGSSQSTSPSRRQSHC